ncbi:PQQ-dependent sugar dehydrogenase [uncultured Sphingomonas sp.]|nr:PQQ-dependent sugar dehydrogenase [uncultured Sphingomonas sp.]
MLIGACSASSSAADEQAAPAPQSDNAAAQAAGGSAPRTSGRPFSSEPVASFSTPWAMAFLPGSGVAMTNRALVSEKEGLLWLVDVASGQKQQVSRLPENIKVAGQGGLGDVVVHPDFAGNQRVYLSFVEPGPNGTSGAAVGYGTLEMAQNGSRLNGFKVVWRQQPKVSGDGHFSHRIAFAPDGSMFVSSGDRQKMEPAQDRGGDLGKVFHLTAEGQPVGGRFHTLGHRNVLGLAFAPDGRLWAHEMGPKGGDEVNLIEAGKNYGWPQASYGSHYEGRTIPDDHRGRGFEEPKVWWTPSISPAGMIVYSGDLFPQWKGDILMGALSGESLIRVDVNGAGARKGNQWTMDARIREVEQGPRGELYLLEDAGRLLRLEPARG